MRFYVAIGVEVWARNSNEAVVLAAKSFFENIHRTRDVEVLKLTEDEYVRNINIYVSKKKVVKADEYLPKSATCPRCGKQVNWEYHVCTPSQSG